jgi:hypothetical protein
MRLYYYGVFGAIGGLIGWQVSNLTGLSFSQNLYLNEVLVGGLIGLSVGLLIGFGDGIATRNLVQTGRSSLVSGLLGLVGGGLGLPLGEFLFQRLGGAPWARASGWALFGLLIGVAAGISGGSQVWKGALGGLLGGALGGGLLEATLARFSNPLFGKAFGLILLGAAVGVFIALIVYLLSRAWFKVESGKLQGTEIILDKFIKADVPAVYMGSSALKADIVFPDPDIAPQHALLSGAGSHFTLKDISLNGTLVNNKQIQTTRLGNNQTIQMGNTRIKYHEKKR